MITDYTPLQLAKILEIIFPQGQWSTKDSQIVAIPESAEMPTEEQMAAALESVEAQQSLTSARKIWPTVADFYAEFTPTEKYLIQSSTIPAIVVARGDLAMWRGDVWSDNADVLAGLDAMVTAGVLTAERRAEILAK